MLLFFTYSKFQVIFYRVFMYLSKNITELRFMKKTTVKILPNVNNTIRYKNVFATKLQIGFTRVQTITEICVY